ncbi:putative glycosyltransferase RT0329 [Planktothrix tepida]|uniref:Glycosyl transferase n=1 Tax=Planktothrix tepida PCC 9214 TaxID=671072 RepID=A0A1J1LS18_9CYAN|nr:glycosyltransferase [Planktothrix tepida]CAD5962250.1 putative glycosyltransferase RT0329 [Planktothrix tepida]CUR34810.1 Glycosyl transferase [Planktothrix tepida PCC 9214]
MLSSSPRISIIIPTYNGDHYISQAIDSVLSQTYSNYEIIIVDDGSTDNTLEIIQHYIEKYQSASLIRYIFQPNQGVAAARNLGIQEARGEFIALLDQDDMFWPEKLAHQVACFQANPDVAIVNSGWRLIDQNNNRISDIEPWHNLPNLTLETWVTRTPILPSALMFRREAWQQIGGFDSRFNGVDDVDFIWRLALREYSAIWLPEITVNYRQHQETVSNTKAKERANLMIAVQDQFFGQPNLPDEIRQLEKLTRYESLTWMAWHLYHTHHPQQMAEFLQKSLPYTPYTVAITISDWVHRFMGYCLAYGYELELENFYNLQDWKQLISKIIPQTKPRVSVIIPTYNCDQYIEQCVKSVLEQTYTNYEVIVIDDGSQDKTQQILKPFLPVIKYIYQNNQGAAKARNHGCKIAQGEFLAFLDGDDFFLPQKLAEQVATFDNDPTIDLVQSGWCIVNQKGIGVSVITPWGNAPELNLETWVLHKCVRPSAMILRREWWEKVGGFDHHYPPTEDLDFVLRLSLMGCKTVWFKEIHACYRQHDHNLMSGGLKVIENTEIVMNQFFNHPNLPDQIRRLRRKESYERWVWLAWRMYRDGYPDLMIFCLENSIKYTFSPLTETISQWLDAFQNIAADYGEKIDTYALIKSQEWQSVLNKIMNPKLSTESKPQLTPATNKPHIMLMNTDDPGIGGLAQYDHLILCELAKLGYRVTAVRPQHYNPLVEEEKELGIQQYWLDYSTSQDLPRILRNTQDAETLYQEIKPDFIIFSDGWPYSHFAAKQVAIQQNIPYMMAIGLAMPEHIDFTMGDNVPYAKGVLYQYGLARTFNTAAYEHLNILQEKFGLPKDKGNVVYYGRSEKYFAPPNLATRQRLRQEIGIPEDGIMCLTTARLAPIKGHRFQLEAIAKLKHTKIWDKLYFVWAGTGQGSDHNLEPELKEKVEHLGVSDRVIFLGQRWDIPDWLDACDIFVLTSLAEAAPSFAIMEAMAKGLPIIASAAGGIPEGLGETGKLLTNPNIDPQKTVTDLVQALQELAVNPLLLSKMGVASKQRAEELFKEDRMLKQTLTIIKQALEAEFDSDFANQPQIKTGIKQLNQQLNYASCLWNAWFAYTQNNQTDMLKYLQASLKVSTSEFITETLLDWVEDFVRLSTYKNQPLNTLTITQSSQWKYLMETLLGIRS